MPSLLQIIFDVVNGKLVRSSTSPDLYSIRDLYQEDAYTIDLIAVRPTGKTVPYYEIISLSGYAPNVYVGPAGAPAATATGWTTSADGKTVTGVLDMNTSGITTLLTANSVTTIFEVKLSSGASNTSRVQQNVTVRKSVGVVGSPSAPPGQLALGSTDADRLYLRKEGLPGDAITLTSPTTGKQWQIYVDDTLGLQMNPIN